MSYHVTECVLTGLVPQKLRGNFAQRRRSYATYLKILFSKHGALIEPGLSLLQRYMYFSTPMIRLLSIALSFFDVVAMLVMLAGFVVRPSASKDIVVLLTVNLFAVQLPRLVEYAGGRAVFKSFLGNELFNFLFRYSTIKGLFTALLGSRMSWKSAEKSLCSPARVPREDHLSE